MAHTHIRNGNVLRRLFLGEYRSELLGCKVVPPIFILFKLAARVLEGGRAVLQARRCSLCLRLRLRLRLRLWLRLWLRLRLRLRL